MVGVEYAAGYNDTPVTYDIIKAAFERAYPEREAAALEHAVRNFSQVVSGVIDIGMKQGSTSEEVTPTELANSMVVWCVANSRLEDYFEAGVGHLARSGPIPAAEADQLMREIAARTADWLVGIEALKAEPRLYSAFIKGSASLGASWADRPQ